MGACYSEGAVPEYGTAITQILPPMPLFSKDGARAAKKENVLQKLKAFFDRFFDVAGGVLGL